MPCEIVAPGLLSGLSELCQPPRSSRVFLHSVQITMNLDRSLVVVCDSINGAARAPVSLVFSRELYNLFPVKFRVYRLNRLYRGRT
jgi:hypothetical protein